VIANAFPNRNLGTAAMDRLRDGVSKVLLEGKS
jgi:hypothetical protein